MVSSNDVRRLFLQALLSRRVLSQELAVKLWGKCIDAVKGVPPIARKERSLTRAWRAAADDALEIPFADDRNSWDNFVSEINVALNPLDLEFVHMFDEISGTEMCGLVNRKGDDVAQMGTDYTAVEIAYFKAVVEQIMLAPNESYCVSSLAALREASSLKSNMSKTQAEVVLGSFVAKGWLTKSKRGRYSLSTRTLLELQPYLKSTYPDEIIECTICMDMVTRGIACYTANCKTRMHDRCFQTYRRHNQKCPTCDGNWSTDANTKKLIPIGERAFKEGQEGRRRIRRQNTADSDEGEGDAEGEDDDEAEPSQPSQPSQSQAKKKGKKKATQPVDDSMDVDEEPPSQPTRTQQKRKSRRG
ncbi:Nse1 non-SMC component of SMC5-6 complex-domain-containing protein [Amylocystis lapponica]|nr:Nse1 non-SMC component of SMC5-6 complex-domain-containing protein [Amylocystis lapponica]